MVSGPPKLLACVFRQARVALLLSHVAIIDLRTAILASVSRARRTHQGHRRTRCRIDHSPAAVVREALAARAGRCMWKTTCSRWRDSFGRINRWAKASTSSFEDPGVAERLDRFLKLHYERRRAAPRTCSSAVEVSSSFLARSAGVRRNCSTSSVKSMPWFWAASIRLPRAG
jgi:hypothetical protein